MKKTKEDTITMEDYDRYPYWFNCSGLKQAIDRGGIRHIELVKTSFNTTGHRLYKFVTDIGNVYTVKVETTFKAAPLENFINEIINGMSAKYEKDIILSPEKPLWIPSAERKARDDLRFEAYRKGYRDGQIDTFHALAEGEEVLNKLREDKE